MQQTGTVIRLEGDVAVVRVRRVSACGKCHAQCDRCANNAGVAWANNAVGAKVGDTVLIELETGRVLFAAFLVYVLPLVLSMLGGFLLGPWVGVVVFVLSFAWLWATDRSKAAKMVGTITKKIDRTDEKVL